MHTISQYYGQAFDSTGYLNKFFDINIYLPEIPKYAKENSIFKTNNEQYFIRQMVEELSEYYRLSLRDAIIYQQNMEATSKQYYNDHFAQGCMLSIFVPIIKILELVDQMQKKEFIEGKGDTFKELCENIPCLEKIICRFGDSNGNAEEKYRTGLEKVKEVYECTFNNKPYNGTLEIQHNLKELCTRVCNGDQ